MNFTNSSTAKSICSAYSDLDESNVCHSAHSLFNDIIRALNTYVTPLIILVGVFGNVMSFLVFTLTHLRHQSSSVYLACLALVDIGFLLALFISWFGWINIHLFHKEGWCQLVIYITYVCSFLSVWCVVSFTTERYIVVSCPFKRYTLCTIRNARLVVCGLSGYAILVYSYVLWTSGVQTFNGRPYCAPLPRYFRASFILSHIDTFTTLILPSVSIIALNVFIVCKLGKFRRSQLPMNVYSIQRQSRLLSSHEASERISSFRHPRCTQSLRTVQRVRSSQFKITRMLLIVSSVFLFLNLPSHAYRIYAFFNTIFSEYLYPNETQRRYQQLVQFLYYISFSINFFLYSLCGKNFRRGLNRLIVHARYKCRLTIRNWQSYICIRFAHSGSSDEDIEVVHIQDCR